LTSLFIQYDHDPEPFALTGAAETTAVALVRPLTIYYTNGSSDTIPTGTVAVLADGVTHTFDRSLAVWVIWTVPGSGLLYATVESQLAGITGDYAPILRVLRHDVQPYRPMQPSGTAFKAGAWSGGAVFGFGNAWTGGASYGALDSQSWSGGASVSGVSFHPAYNNNESRFGIYVYCTSVPASRTTIYDLDAGANGYERVSLTSAGHVVTEFSNAGVTYSVDLGALPLNEWCWISTATNINIANNDALICHSALYNGVGTLLAAHSDSNLNMATNRVTAFTAIFSVGLPGSGGYAAAPNNSTLKFSKLRHINSSSVTWLSPLASDISSDLNDYMARQTLGSAATLDDTGTSNQDMTAGSNGLTINLVGPYP
jgi:hypothetical protein